MSETWWDAIIIDILTVNGFAKLSTPTGQSRHKRHHHINVNAHVIAIIP